MTVDYFLIMAVGCYTLFRIVEVIVNGLKHENPTIPTDHTVETLVEEIDSLNDDLVYETNPNEIELIKKKLEIRNRVLVELLKKEE